MDKHKPAPPPTTTATIYIAPTTRKTTHVKSCNKFLNKRRDFPNNRKPHNRFQIERVSLSPQKR